MLWDVIVVGTGMGGATAGYELARSGLKVLFCEQGYSTLYDGEGIKDVYPEEFIDTTKSESEQKEVLKCSGRYSEKIVIESGGKQQKFYPLIGEGTGGSSALYGMVLERLRKEDFDTPLWPLKEKDWEPFYKKAEALYQINQGKDWPPLTVANQELVNIFSSQGVNPYRLPMACSFDEDCKTCQNYLCKKECKKHAGNVALKDAIEKYGAELVTDCKVLKIEAQGRTAKKIYCSMGGQEISIKGKAIILAAGALNTPAILLQSKSPGHPNGLCNSSGLVGKNLMRHYIDIYAIRTKNDPGRDEANKQIGINDFLYDKEMKLGTVQSFGLLPPIEIILNDIEEDVATVAGTLAAKLFRLFRPFVGVVIKKKLSQSVLMASIMEDEGAESNLVYPEKGEYPSCLHIHYKISAQDKNRIQKFRKTISNFLKSSGYSFMLLKQAENDKRLAHVCGTCRFGTNPESSVLDIWCKSHDIDNIFVVDSSFFPTSGSTNPALTIAANAIRVAEYIVKHCKTTK